MTVRHRYVYAIPDPYMNERVLLAVVYRGVVVRGAITFDHPAVEVFGSAFAALYAEFKERLEAEPSWSQYEAGFGPHVVFGPALKCLSASWVEANDEDSEVEWLHGVLANHPGFRKDEE
jgi:hypothetical protein